jgi:hypothetical protein
MKSIRVATSELVNLMINIMPYEAAKIFAAVYFSKNGCVQARSLASFFLRPNEPRDTALSYIFNQFEQMYPEAYEKMEKGREPNLTVSRFIYFNSVSFLSGLDEGVRIKFETEILRRPLPHNQPAKRR